MARLIPRRTDTKIIPRGEVLPGDEECGNQTRRELPGLLYPQAERVKTPVSLRFRLSLRWEARRVHSVGEKRGPHERSNGEYPPNDLLSYC